MASFEDDPSPPPFWNAAAGGSDGPTVLELVPDAAVDAGEAAAMSAPAGSLGLGVSLSAPDIAAPTVAAGAIVAVGGGGTGVAVFFGVGAGVLTGAFVGAFVGAGVTTGGAVGGAVGTGVGAAVGGGVGAGVGFGVGTGVGVATGVGGGVGVGVGAAFTTIVAVPVQVAG